VDAVRGKKPGEVWHDSIPADPSALHRRRTVAIERLLLLTVGLLAATVVILAAIVFLQRRFAGRVDDVAMQSGAQPFPVVRLPMDRILPLLQPLDFTRTEKVFHLGVRGYDALVIQWRAVFTESLGPHPTRSREGPAWHAYLILGCGGPHLRMYPKAIFGKPADCVRVSWDRRLSRRFHVQAGDQQAVQWYLGPALRRFLLAQPTRWSFHAEPSGVALVAGGELSRSEARSMKTVLEMFLSAAEPTRIS
jgi:hypothetical protein